MKTASPIKLGLIGKGPWGKVYAKTLRKLGINFWHSDRVYGSKGCDGVIIASAAESHFQIAKDFIHLGIPVLIEKPVCMRASEAKKLLAIAEHMDGIVFAGHTRLYSPAWRQFKTKMSKLVLTSVECQAGGRCKIDHRIDWGSHLVAMCLDLGFDPKSALIATSDNEMPFRFRVNGKFVFDDPATDPMPLEVLIKEFIEAIGKEEPDLHGLEMGVKVMEYLDGA